MRNLRFRSIAAAFTMTTVFFLFQNFSELNIDPNIYRYQITELKHLSTHKAHSLAYGSNSNGEVIGQSLGDDGRWHTVKWSVDGNVKDLGVREEFRFEKSKKDTYYHQPFSPKGVWIGPTHRDFGVRDSVCKGECKFLGELSQDLQLGYEDFGSKQIGLVRARGKATLKVEPLLNTERIFSNSVNTHSQVVGFVTSKSASTARAFLWKNGKTIDLGTARGGYSSANDINDMGQIVGETLDENQVMRPVLWSVIGQNVSAFDLTQGMTRAGSARSINNEGQVVGFIQGETGTQPFLWTAETGIQNLNSLTKEADPLNSQREWILEDGKSINNCGHIVGWGRKVKGSSGYSVLLKPTQVKPGC